MFPGPPPPPCEPEGSGSRRFRKSMIPESKVSGILCFPLHTDIGNKNMFYTKNRNSCTILFFFHFFFFKNVHTHIYIYILKQMSQETDSFLYDVLHKSF